MRSRASVHLSARPYGKEQSGFNVFLTTLLLLLTAFACVSTGLLTNLLSGPDVPSAKVSAAQRSPQRYATPVFLHYFDWFHEHSWQENAFVDPIDWSALGIQGSDRSSEDFYYRQFVYIKSLGVDALAWEYNPRVGLPPSYPSPEAVRALQRSGLKIAPFEDLEIAFKVRNQQQPIATLSNPNAIQPTNDTADFIVAQLSEFYAHVPSNLLAQDAKGRSMIYVFGYGFDDSHPNPARWSSFATRLLAGVEKYVGPYPVFYWTAQNSVFEEHLFQHFGDNFVPFQFVLDTPQSQYAHDSVTWNFGFDNLGVQKRDGLLRVIRLDPRYVEEMGWLSKAANPSAVFIYSWDEPFEGSMLIPTKNWGDTKARLAEELIHRMKYGSDRMLPKTLLIVDDLDASWTTRQDDWHLDTERAMLLYPMRRFAPQADVRMVSQITPELLDQYPDIIDLSSNKSSDVSSWLLAHMRTHRIMVFDPLAVSTGDALARYFATLGPSPAVNTEIQLHGGIYGSGATFSRDDINLARPCDTCQVKVSATLPRLSIAPTTPNTPSVSDVPVVVTRGSDVWVNAYNVDERILAPAFASFYGMPMHISIMYGEMLASQRLEIDAKTHQVKENMLARYSVDGHWAIPQDINWYRMPPDVDPKYYDFIFDIHH